MPVTSSYKMIHDHLLNDGYGHIGIHEHPWAFCVSATIMKDFKKIKQRLSAKTTWESFDYRLQIGEKYFHMCIIYVSLVFTEELDIIRELIRNSQFSHPWHDTVTLFINVESYRILKQFIQNHNLEGSIIKVEETAGICVSGGLIKVITFDKSVSALDILPKYKAHLKSNEAFLSQPYYYMTFVFPWLQPRWLHHFNIEIDNKLYFTLSIVSSHLRTLDYVNELNIFELLLMKLAFCDFRIGSSPSNDIQRDIDFMITRKLISDIVQKSHFDLERYESEKNYVARDLLISYLVYEYQHICKTIRTRPKDTFTPPLGTDKPNSIVELAHVSDYLNVINEQTRTTFYVDGRGYDKMSLKVFCDIAQCSNVYAIRVDTKYEWLSSNSERGRETFIDSFGGRCYVFLVGENCKNLIEGFLTSFKTLKFSMRAFSLHIYCNLKDYAIFDQLKVYRVDFDSIEINKHILDGLHSCKDLKSIIRVYNATFENSLHNWALLNGLHKLNYADIFEDENTWEPLFELCAVEALKSTLKEFQFDNKIIKVISAGRRITLEPIKFILDEYNTKIDLYDMNTNQIIDLFDLKFDVEYSDRSEFEFYQ